MKRILFFLVVATISLTSAQSQIMKAGVGAGIPIGDASDIYSFGVHADFNYLFDVAESIQVGPMAGLIYYKGKTIDYGYKPNSQEPTKGSLAPTTRGGDVVIEGSMKVDDAIFLPVGGHARYSIGQLFVGADLGYAIGVSPSGMKGGFLIRPKVGYNFGSLAGVASYSAITRNGGTFSTINVGVEFTF